MNNKKAKFYMRVRQQEREYLVSVCDKKLLGETVEGDDIELYVSERFFGGKLVSLEECLLEMRKATSFNLIGKQIVDAAIKERLVSELAVLWVDCQKHGNVGHVMLIR
ncbi:MAG: DUF424 family protein [Asgard group archaeon]|nr:DUF424 family protein [Asgard group archaeon]